MSYQTAVDKMYSLGHELGGGPSRKFDLAHMRTLLAELNHPERTFPGILIAGTNGKGSTAATLAAILQASGVKTGLYTSPHLLRINERIQINGSQISDDDFARHHDGVDRTAEKLVSNGQLPWHPSFFEMLTAIAFEYFAQNKIDIAVLEVGMGGRLDATNVIDPIISIVTDISLDHQMYLGHTITQIAGEKAGIIRERGIVVTLPQHPEANDVIGNKILELNAKAVNAVPYVPPVSPASADHFGVSGEFALPVSRYPLAVLGKQIMVETPLIGRHQFRNIALAIAAAVELATVPLLAENAREKWGTHYPITSESIARGICETRWPGRFQVEAAHDDAPEFIFDVAHNPAGAWALRSTLSTRYADKKLVFVFGAMRDKAVAEIAEILFPLAETVIVTQADNPRSATTAEIRQDATRTSTIIEESPNVAAAIDRAKALAHSHGVVVVTGSIYIVGEAMRELRIQPLADNNQRNHLMRQGRDC